MTERGSANKAPKSDQERPSKSVMPFAGAKATPVLLGALAAALTGCSHLECSSFPVQQLRCSLSGFGVRRLCVAARAFGSVLVVGLIASSRGCHLRLQANSTQSSRLSAPFSCVPASPQVVANSAPSSSGWLRQVHLMRFVIVQAPLALRTFLRQWDNALPVNKSNNYAPCGRRTRLAPRLFLNRYVFRGRINGND